VLIELSWRGVIEMTGRDRIRFLHGMCTNDIKKLQPGQGCMAAIVNRQGRMVAEMIVHVAESALLLQVDRSILRHTIDALSKFLIADDVTLKIADIAVFGIYGPRARTLLGSGDLPDFHGILRDGALLAGNRTIAPEGFDLLAPAAKTGEVDRLLALGMEPAGFEAYEELRIESGFPRWGADMDDTVLPMEAGLEPIAISYTKGCYIGQEVIQRVKTYSEPPRTLVHLDVEGAARGDKITAGDGEIGQVTSAARSGALGYVRKEFKAPGMAVMVAGRAARVGSLPWQARLATP
jgi:folate-binding protein YgfZ